MEFFDKGIEQQISGKHEDRIVQAVIHGREIEVEKTAASSAIVILRQLSI